MTDVDTFVKRHYLFAPLDIEARKRLLQRSKRRRYPAGNLIFTKNQAATDFYLVLQGNVRLYFSAPDGKEKTLKTFAGGESFGEALMFMRRDTYPANAMSTEDTDLLVINSREFRDNLLKSPDLCLAIMGHLSEHVQTLSKQVEMLSVFDARARLLHYLNGQLSGDRANGATYPLLISKKDLAEYLAIRPETLSRLLKQLEQDRVMNWNQHGVTVLDWAKMQA